MINFPQNSGMKRITLQQMDELEWQLRAAPPSKVAKLVRKYVRLRRKFAEQ